MFHSNFVVADPLFIDPYAAVLLSLDVAHQALESLVLHLMPWADHYRLTTRYLDDKLQHLIASSDNFRQVLKFNQILFQVFFHSTCGARLIPYRLFCWQMEWTLVHIGWVGQGCLSCTMYHLEESSAQQPSNSEVWIALCCTDSYFWHSEELGHVYAVIFI